MAITSASQVYDSVAKYLWREDMAGMIPDLVLGAEQIMNYGTDDIPPLRSREMEATATITLTGNAGTLPTDYLQYRRIRSNSSPIRDLEYAEPSWISFQYPDTTTQDASFFTIIGSTISTAPPSSSSILLDYYQAIPSLSSNPTGNWVTQKVPMLYIYATCLHASIFLDDDERLGTFANVYGKLAKGFQGADVMARYSRSVSRVRGVTP